MKFLFLLLLIGACNSEEKIKSQSVVEVEDYKLTVREMAMRMAEKMQGSDLVVTHNPEYIQNLKKSILEEFLHEALIRKWSEQENIIVTPQDLEERINSIRKQYPNDEALREALAQENIPYERWVDKVKRNVLEQKVVFEITKQVDEISDEQLKDYYEKNKRSFYQQSAARIRQIIVEKQSQAEKLKKQINKGASFASLAQEYSIGPAASSGGEIGWMEKGVAEVFDKALRLPIKRVSKPIQSPYGYHLIEVLEKRSARQRTFPEVKDIINKDLIEDEKQAAYAAWIDKQKKTVKVKVNADLLNAIQLEVKE